MINGIFYIIVIIIIIINDFTVFLLVTCFGSIRAIFRLKYKIYAPAALFKGL